jgi:hypothetical protein
VGQKHRHSPRTRVKLERLTIPAESAMGDEVSEFSTDDHHVVIEFLRGRIAQIQRGLELVALVRSRKPSHVVAGCTMPGENGEVDENMFGPTEEALDRGQSKPFGFAS